MDNNPVCIPPSDEDLRSALKAMGSYIDITESDLKKIYTIALHHAQERLAKQTLVRDVMRKSVVSVKRDTDLREAARVLADNRISGLPVLDDGDKVIGVISEADILTLAGIKRLPVVDQQGKLVGIISRADIVRSIGKL